jgi:hypothetical protein
MSCVQEQPTGEPRIREKEFLRQLRIVLGEVDKTGGQAAAHCREARGIRDGRRGSKQLDARVEVLSSAPPISAFTTSIICAAEFPVTDCRSCCATTRSLMASAGSPYFRALRCVRLVLWDEGQQRLVSFREVRRHCASCASSVRSA